MLSSAVVEVKIRQEPSEVDKGRDQARSLKRRPHAVNRRTINPGVSAKSAHAYHALKSQEMHVVSTHSWVSLP